MPVDSPCVRLCTLDAQDICIGCGRTLDEICRWSSMTEAEQRKVVAGAGIKAQAFRARRESRHD